MTGRQFRAARVAIYVAFGVILALSLAILATGAKW